MTKQTLLSRRLRSTDIETWSRLNDDRDSILSPVEQSELVRSSFELENSIFYTASVKDEDIGGAAIFRDKTRLGVAILSLKLNQQYRDTTTLHLIRTCLPFFRSVSIRQIDALVNASTINPIPFPLSFEIEAWALSALKGLRFVDVSSLHSYSWSSVDIQSTKSQVEWDQQPDLAMAQRLMWNERKNSGLDCSQAYFSLELGHSHGTLKTGRYDEEEHLACTIELVRDLLIFGVIVNSESIDAHEVARAVLSSVVTGTKKRVYLSVMGQGQKKLVSAFSDIFQNTPRVRELLLVRRLL